MTKQSPPPPPSAGASSPQPEPILLDVVSGHLRRSLKHFEHEALMLATSLRDVHAALAQEQAKSAALEAELAALRTGDGGA